MRAFANNGPGASCGPRPPAADPAGRPSAGSGPDGHHPLAGGDPPTESSPSDQRLPGGSIILQDRRFADNFAERFARAFVGTEDGPFILYRRRRFVAWLGEQFAQNRPYDQIVRELIAAEGLWTDKPATNFVSVTVQPDNKNQPDPVRLAGRVTRAFLGLRLDCAQCHNHPLRRMETVRFPGIIRLLRPNAPRFHRRSRRTRRVRGEGPQDTGIETVAPGVPFAAELLPENGSRRSRLAYWVTDAKNPYFARAAVNRVWALMLGRPLVEPVDNLESDAAAPPALQLLADDFAAHGFDLRRLIRVIASTEVFRLDSAAEHDSRRDGREGSGPSSR